MLCYHKIKQVTSKNEKLISHMFHSGLRNIKNEKVTKLEPGKSLTPSSSVMSFRSGKYPSLEELCNFKAKDVFTSTPLFELVYINRYVKRLLFYHI